MSLIAIYFFINTTLYTLQISPTEKLSCFTALQKSYTVFYCQQQQQQFCNVFFWSAITSKSVTTLAW